MRIAKKPERVNVLLVGAESLGKSSFISTVLKKEIESTEEFSEHRVVIENVPVHFFECRGYGSCFKTVDRFAQIESFVRESSKKFLVEETKVARDPFFEDTRVHLIILFASVSGNGVKEHDLSLLSLLHNKANVLVVIPKSDYYTEEEIRQVRTNIVKRLESANIDMFTLHEVPADKIPLAITTGQKGSPDEKSYSTRQTPSGTVFVDNEMHSDHSLLLRSILEAKEDLIHTTNMHFYEKYRSAMLSE